MNKENRELIIQRVLRGEATSAELDELRQWVETDVANRRFFAETRNSWNAIGASAEVDETTKARERARLQKRLRQMKQDSARHTFWWQAAAASVLIGVVGGGVYYWQHGETLRQMEALSSDEAKGQVQLTLSDGHHIELTDDEDFVICTDHETGLQARDGGLDYTHVMRETATEEPEILYNKVETMTGSVYHMTLADGSQVWLNSQSGLRFPIRFDGSERRVYLSGEAYFEVSRDAKRPFIVTTDTGSFEVEVYGTHFDVDAYNSHHIRTTLVEGSVGIRDRERGAEYLMKPNTTALFNALNGKIDIEACDASEYALWRQGILAFEEMRVDELMTRIARLHNIEVSYATDSVREVCLTGMLSNTGELSALLAHLESVSNLKFEQTGRKILIRQ